MNLILRGSHPHKRPRKRGIEVADIEHAILHRHYTGPSGEPDSLKYYGPARNGRDLTVCVLFPGYRNDVDPVVLKTVWWR